MLIWQRDSILESDFFRYGNISTKIDCLSFGSAKDHGAKCPHLSTSSQQDQGYVWFGQGSSSDRLSSFGIFRYSRARYVEVYPLNQTWAKGYRPAVNMEGKSTALWCCALFDGLFVNNGLYCCEHTYEGLLVLLQASFMDQPVYITCLFLDGYT